jgi:release factor glutamine methyltransferase
MHSIKTLFLQVYNQLVSYYKSEQLAYFVANQLIKLHFTYDYILLPKDILINDESIKILKKQIDDIVILHMPYQYILEEVVFCNTIIKISPPILIPRIETEELVFWITEKLKTQKDSFLNIVDFCSGSGCIGIALLHFFQNSHCTAFDICEKSVKIAAHNAVINKVKQRYTIHQKDIFTLKKNKKYDIIISNPPYISIDDYRQLDLSVLQWESKQALTDQENGYRYILYLLKTSRKKLKNDGIIIIEICHSYADFILQETKKIYTNELVFLWIDQYNKKRAIIISKGKLNSLVL